MNFPLEKHKEYESHQRNQYLHKEKEYHHTRYAVELSNLTQDLIRRRVFRVERDFYLSELQHNEHKDEDLRNKQTYFYDVEYEAILLIF